MITIRVLLLGLALLCFGAAAIGVPTPPSRFNLIGAGLFLWVLTVFVTAP